MPLSSIIKSELLVRVANKGKEFINIEDAKNIVEPILLGDRVTVVEIGKNSRVTLLEKNPCQLYLHLNEGAQVTHIKIGVDTKNISRTDVTQDRATGYKSLVVSAGSFENNIKVTCLGENTQTRLLGIYLADKKDKVVQNISVDHKSYQGESEQLYRGILDDKAEAYFSGDVRVAPNTHGNKATQKNQTLLLSDEATMITKPELEILSDDVRCSHGATVGQLNKNEIFYLKARGIGDDLARLILMQAFLNEVLNQEMAGLQAARELSHIIKSWISNRKTKINV